MPFGKKLNRPSMLVRLGELLVDFPGAIREYNFAGDTLTGSVTYPCDKPSTFDLAVEILEKLGLEESLLPISCFKKEEQRTVSGADFFGSTPKIVEFSFTIPLIPELEAYLSKPFLIQRRQISVNGHTDTQELSLFNPSKNIVRTSCCISQDPFALDTFRHLFTTLPEGTFATEEGCLLFEKNGENLSITFEGLRLTVEEGKSEAYSGYGQVFNPFLIFYTDKHVRTTEPDEVTKEKMVAALAKINQEAMQHLKPAPANDVHQYYQEGFVCRR